MKPVFRFGFSAVQPQDDAGVGGHHHHPGYEHHHHHHPGDQPHQHHHPGFEDHCHLTTLFSITNVEDDHSDQFQKNVNL